MTDKQDPITHAARLLREAAEELRQAHTLSSDRNNWIGEPEAKAAYDEHMAAAQALEDWEAAVGAGGEQALSAAPAEALGYFSFSDECGFDRHDTAEAAKAAATEMLSEIRRELGGDEWPMDVESICWGVVVERATEHDQTTGEDGEKYCDYVLKGAPPTPPAEQQAEDNYIKLLAECRCAFPVPEPGSPLEVQWAAAMARPEEVPEYVRACVAAMQAAPKAAPVLPEGWTACTIEFGNDGPEEVAYGPQRMMTRLAKWLGKYFAQVIADAAPKAAPGDNRKAFESWARRQPWIKDCGKASDGDAYGHWDTQKAWLAWSAALAAPQQEAQEPVSPRHPVVMQWRDNAIEACAKIADAYGHEHAAQDMRAMLTAPQQEAQEPFQNRVQPWLLQCFGAEIAADTVERNHRFLEEALELVQYTGCTQSEAHQLVDYVFGRPVGDPAQEVGGVMVTLAALCLASGLDMHNAGEAELARIWTKVEAIRAKQAAKPKHSPLPQVAPQPTPAPLIARSLAEWHEQDGNVAWWAWNGREWAGEPAWIGTPNCEDWPGYHTHWTPHPEQPVCAALAAQRGKA